jgi:phosphatidylglycerophosphatase A
VRQAITFLATGAYVGLIPVAPGTFGSLLGIPLLLVLARLELSPASVLSLVGAIALLAMAVCERAGRDGGEMDRGSIVLDEICGMLVAGALIAPTARALTLVFVVFRLLDIVKPFPAGYLDRRLKNGVGVVGDDLVAGLYTNLLVRTLV